jgi:hypothetical protein
LRGGRRILPLALVYSALALVTVPLSIAYDVGAKPGEHAEDMLLTGTGFTPPLFLLLLLAGGAAPTRARRRVAIGRAVVVTLIALAMLGGSPLNLASDVKPVRAAGAPVTITYVVAAISVALALVIAAHACVAIIGLARRRGEPGAARETG